MLSDRVGWYKRSYRPTSEENGKLLGGCKPRPSQPVVCQGCSEAMAGGDGNAELKICRFQNVVERLCLPWEPGYSLLRWWYLKYNMFPSFLAYTADDL